MAIIECLIKHLSSRRPEDVDIRVPAKLEQLGLNPNDLRHKGSILIGSSPKEENQKEVWHVAETKKFWRAFDRLSLPNA